MTFKTYHGGRVAAEDAQKIHTFLVQAGNAAYTYTRFDWMMTNWEYLEDQHLDRIGMWEEDGTLVTAMLFDHSLDVIFLVVLPGYTFLYQEMLDYGRANMVKDDASEFLLFASDSNRTLQKLLHENGMIATEEKELVAAFDLTQPIPEIPLEQGFELVSLHEKRDYKAYLKCLFKGFGHEADGEVFSFTEDKLAQCRMAYERQYVDLSLKISVLGPDGAFVSHAGVWYDRNSEFAVLEPVCTVPEYRKMGFGKAAVYEGLRRAKARGAKMALVGSGQQFYSSLGFAPFSTGTVWKWSKR